jgi:hypothetical protein
MHGSGDRFIENTIRKQWMLIMKTPEPCSERKASGVRVARCDYQLSLDLFPILNKKPDAVSRIASRVYPTCASIKKPISGQPEIGAHFMSFNFTDTSLR